MDTKSIDLVELDPSRDSHFRRRAASLQFKVVVVFGAGRFGKFRDTEEDGYDR